MKENLLKRVFCFLLVFVMVFSTTPFSAFATETDTGTVPAETAIVEETEPAATEVAQEETTSEESTEETTEPAETTEEPTAESSEPTEAPTPTGTTEPTVPEASTEPTVPKESTEATDPTLPEDPRITGIELASDATTFAATKYDITVIGQQYRPSGNSTFVYDTPYAKDHEFTFVQFRRVTVDGVQYPAYCIAPGQTAEAGNYTGVEVTTEDSWDYSLPEPLTWEQQKLIGLILLYGYPNNTVLAAEEGSYAAISYEIATQLMIWEVIIGIRETEWPYTCTNTGLVESYTDDAAMYVNMYTGYSIINDALIRHDMIPSFMSSVESKAPTHILEIQEDGTYFLSLTDSSKDNYLKYFLNGYSRYESICFYDFENTETLTFDWPKIEDDSSTDDGSTDGSFSDGSISGGGITEVPDQGLFPTPGIGGGTTAYPYLNITSTEPIPEPILISPTKEVMNLDETSFLVLHTGGDDQTNLAMAMTATPDPVPSYFKIRTAGGGLQIIKTTSDGNNLEGWEFTIYDSNGDVAATGTTDAEGKLSIILAPGTYTVVETIPDDSAYTCTNNSQEVTVVDGETATVTFLNELQSGQVTIQKATNTGKNLNGWQFGIFSDSTCDTLVETLTTDENGKATSGLLAPGTYYIKETVALGGWLCDTTVQTVTIEAGKTITLDYTFTNVQLGQLKILKTTNTGENLDGWEFGVYSDSVCTTLVATLTTGTDGTATSDYLTPGTYYIKETSSKDGWVSDTSVKTVTVVAGATTAVSTSFNNTQLGKFTIKKATNTGANLDGWSFSVYSDSACTALVATLTTNTSGTATTGYLTPGLYYVKETSTKTGWVTDASLKSVTVKAGQTVTLDYTFTNIQLGKLQVSKSTNTSLNLDGWSFGVYSDSGCTTLVTTLTTDTNGKAVSGYLTPGTYYIKETTTKEGWITDTSVKSVTVVAGETAAVSTAFSNTQLGKLEISKSTNTGLSLDGWEFGIYSDKNCTTLVQKVTSNSAGKATSGYLTPGTYYVKELTTKEGWVSDTSVKSVTVVAGATTPLSVAFSNTQLGKIQISKSTNTGANLEGWEFGIYSDKDCTNLLEKITTGTTGKATSGYLTPGIVYVKELTTKEGWTSDASVKSVTVVAGTTTSLSTSFVNTQLGKLQVSKTTNTGENLDGWQIGVYSDSSCTTLVETLTTGTDGKAVSGYLTPGAYYMKELTTKEGWVTDTSVKSVTITAGTTTSVGSAFSNTQLGKLKITKATNTGNDLSNWQFSIYSDKNCTVLVETLTSGVDGTAVSGYLTPSTYYIKEITTREGWISDTSVKSVTVVAGEVTAISTSFSNTQLGKIQITKSTNTGNDLDGWQFGIYSDAECTDLIETITTGTDGKATSGYLNPGIIYVKEISSRDGWATDDSVKSVTVAPGIITALDTVFNNTQLGIIQITKITNTGKNLGGWLVDLHDADMKLLGTYTIPDTGVLTIEDLTPGTYYITEQGKTDPYWVCDTEQKTVPVAAGQTSIVTLQNIHNGLAKVKKETNTGENLEGWAFEIYSDEACTQLVTKLTSDANGEGSEYILPGTYYVKEVAVDTYTDEYWTYDAEVKKLVVAAGEEAVVTFTNVHHGKILIQKEMLTDGPLEGWEFKVTKLGEVEADNVEIGTFVTLEDGTFLTEKLLPGNYLIEEIFPEDSLYYCKSENPITVEVKVGETTTVPFSNALRPGRIEIEKVSDTGEHLSGAKFLLEWSEDGTTWQPVVYNESEDVVKGGCSNEAAAEGIQVTGSSGIISYDNLYPGLMYRLTELEAPNGYLLLTKHAFTGELPTDTLEIKIEVVNTKGFTLPKTGEAGFTGTMTVGAVMAVFSMLMIATLPVAFDHKTRKKTQKHH